MTEPQIPNTQQFDSLGRFILPNFQQARPFSSFLPGIAGPHGIPMWFFYVNRGQAAAGFGVESKDRPILEFQPANKAYQMTAALGFRTFLLLQQGATRKYYEPFNGRPGTGVQRQMSVGMNEVEICETNASLGLETRILYFIVPGQPVAALARRVTLRNVGSEPMKIEALDGLPAIIPYGAGNGALKEIGRTIEAWMEVLYLDEGIPFYKLRASAGDTAEVEAIEAGNFALAFMDAHRLPAVVDPVAVFRQDTAFAFPEWFVDGGLQGVWSQNQVCEGRTPCGFFGAELALAPGSSQSITSLYGSAASYSVVRRWAEQVTGEGFIESCLDAARRLVIELTEPVSTHTGSPIFDAYCRQTFLDNLMRGGWPEVLGGKHIYHLYSRKHGDMERDYNYFVLAAEYFSQGNGNYRDVNQNRRSDVFFNPAVGDFNVRLFTSLLQADGYNPLVVQGTVFTVPQEARASILAQVEQPGALEKLLGAPFTPGRLYASSKQCGLRIPLDDFFNLVFSQAQQHIRAEHGEGFWVDHWTYVLDLVESFLAVYPDRKTELLHESGPIPFFDSAVQVRPRRQRYVLSNGTPRQLNALYKDPEKAALLAERQENAHWARAGDGLGEIFSVTLYARLFMLAALKFATRDPFGMGIEMEAGRPGWYDAMNGLPGMFGSSMPEVYELLRLVEFLLKSAEESQRSIELPVEAARLVDAITGQLNSSQDAFSVWEALSNVRESYREAVRLGFCGETKLLEGDELADVLRRMHDSLNAGIQRALDLNDGFPPTYLACQPVDYDVLDDVDADGRPYIRVRSFQPVLLPAFLEGAVRQMKVLDREAARSLHARVRSSDLFDAKLGMYRVNASLADQPHDIGRARAFSPGWLENQSIWLHMSYKYLLELLKAGLYEPFFADLKTNLVPFMDPAVYGRSPLENSSFIVSSAHPDERLHGAGYVARLSGSTAEFLSMWNTMMAGLQPFVFQAGSLELALRPILPGWLFPPDGRLSFRFLGHTIVTVSNPAGRDLTGELADQKSILYLNTGETIELPGGTVPAPYAEMLRAGQIPALEIYFL